MGIKIVLGLVATAALTSIVGCAPQYAANGRMLSQPNGCGINNMQFAAAVGGGLGSLFGQLVASGTRNSTTQTVLVLAGTVAGAAAGAAIGAQQDADCQRWALQLAMDAADLAERNKAAQRAALAEKEAAVVAAEAEAQRLRSLTAQRNLERARRQRDEARAAAQPQYEPVNWASSSGQRGQITPLSNDTEPATNRVCRTIRDGAGVDGSEATSTVRVCRNDNGGWDRIPQ